VLALNYMDSFQNIPQGVRCSIYPIKLMIEVIMIQVSVDSLYDVPGEFKRTVYVSWFFQSYIRFYPFSKKDHFIHHDFFTVSTYQLSSS